MLETIFLTLGLLVQQPAPAPQWLTLVDNERVVIEINTSDVLINDEDKTLEFVVKRTQKTPLLLREGGEVSYMFEAIFVMCNLRHMVVSHQIGFNKQDVQVYENSTSRLYPATNNPRHATTIIVTTLCQVLNEESGSPGQPAPQRQPAAPRGLSASV